MTLHNIPEGLSVGLTFGLAMCHFENVTLISGLIFAIGIGIQNFPEGAALSLPLFESTKSKKKAMHSQREEQQAKKVMMTMGVIAIVLVIAMFVAYSYWG